MKISDFDYQLPESLIAQYPSESRDKSRVLFLKANAELDKGSFVESPKISHFDQILSEFAEGDLLLINNTKVMPARVRGLSEDEGQVELLFLEELSSHGNALRWKCMMKGKRKLGKRIQLPQGVQAHIEGIDQGSGTVEVSLSNLPSEMSFSEWLQKVGSMPIPPYIREGEAEDFDSKRYQTVFAEVEGAVAAPTAGLHFTEALLDRLKKKGVRILPITLHVGIGTFQPVRVEDIREHKMHEERVAISKETMNEIREAKKYGRRITAVGTTVVRACEGASKKILESNDEFFFGSVDQYIYPGYKFHVIDRLITNFHLPRSSLLIMISAFVGRERLMAAYDLAIKEKLRFFSYGDAMFCEKWSPQAD
jgi:S-adenosylmethionine:tRNA ribosyltransferase-isomerase